jgi:hypothetical protein
VQPEARGVEGHHRFAGLEGRRVEGRRAAEADGVALRGQGCSEGVSTGRPEAAQAGDQGLGSLVEVRHEMGGVLVDDGVDQVVGHDVSAQPRRSPPRQPHRRGQGAHAFPGSPRKRAPAARRAPQARFRGVVTPGEATPGSSGSGQ